MLAGSGANVLIADLQADRGEALAKELGKSTRFVKCDVTSENDGQAAVAAALKEFGGPWASCRRSPTGAGAPSYPVRCR
jgi:NAD(P)-dependent dehydrogenase (short-subunit alcohol dehydrogenase family)